MSVITEREMLESASKALEHLRDDILIRSQMQDDYVEGEVFVGFSAWAGLEQTIDYVRAILTQQQEAEPVVYQGRMRPGWDERGIWAQWENCSKGTFEDYKRVPINCDWHFESRALYEHPPKPAALPQKEVTEEEFATVKWASDLTDKIQDLCLKTPVGEVPEWGHLCDVIEESVPESFHQAAQPQVPEGMIQVRIDDLERWRDVVRYAAHPHPSPHADDIDALLSAAKGE